LRRQEERFEEAGVGVVLVGLGSIEDAERFRRRFGVPYPLVADRKRELYKSFRLRRMAPWQVVSPRVALKGIAAMAQGHLAGLPTGDVAQLPGAFLIDTQGRIVFSHYGKDPSDHPDMEALLAAGKKAAAEAGRPSGKPDGQ
jgi:peroxiredoxin